MKRLLLLASVLVSELSNAGPRVDPLREQDIDYGCGCSFQLPASDQAKAATVLQWELGMPANVRVDGRLYKLSIKGLRGKSQDRHPWKVGDKTTFDLKGSGVSVTAACTVTEVCPTERLACEVTHLKAVLTVRTNEGQTVLKAQGTCGC
jgi:hypothetical protein